MSKDWQALTCCSCLTVRSFDLHFRSLLVEFAAGVASYFGQVRSHFRKSSDITGLVFL